MTVGPWPPVLRWSRYERDDGGVNVGDLAYLTIHLDWSEDPLTWDHSIDPTSMDPGSLGRANADAEKRVQLALEPYQQQGWEADGELWTAIDLERQERRVLLPTPGAAGRIGEEYRGADVRLRRTVAASGQDAPA